MLFIIHLEKWLYLSFRKMVVLAFAALKIHAFETEINKVIHEISKIFNYDILRQNQFVFKHMMTQYKLYHTF